MIRRSYLFTLALLCLGVGLLGCQGCQKSTTATTGQLQRLLPKDHKGLLIVPMLGQLPKRLNDLILRFEGPKKPGQPSLGQLHQYVQEFRNTIGVDILDAESFGKHGINPNSPMLAARIRIAKSKAIVVAVGVTNTSRFSDLLKSVGKQRLLVNHNLVKDGVTTLYRKRKNGISEEFAYTFHNGIALVALPVIKERVAKAATRHALTVLKALLQMKPAQSLEGDATLQRKWKRWKKTAQVMLYAPAKPKKKVAPKANAKKNATTRPTSRPVRRRRPTPLLQTIVSTVKQYNPFAESTSALTFGAEGIQLDAGLPLTPARVKRMQGMVPSTGGAAKMIQLLNKRAILGFKLSLNPKQLPSLASRALSTSRMNITPTILFNLLKKHTGLDLQKDLIPALTGHAMMTLYHISPKVYHRFQRSPSLLPSSLELAVVAELKDVKKGNKVLDTLAKVLTIAGAKVKQVPTHDKRRQYKIRAWPGATAYWTIVDKYFIYALGKMPIKLAVQALRKPKFRLYQNNVPTALTANDSIAAHIHLPNLMRSFNSLYISFAIKMAVTSFHALNLKNVEAILFSYRPGKEELELQLKLQLKKAKAKKTETKTKVRK